MPETDERSLIKARIINIVACGCCPISENALDLNVAYLLDGLGYTISELLSGQYDEEMDTLYNYEVWTYEDRRKDSCQKTSGIKQ